MNAVEKISDFLKFGSVLGLERMNIILEKLGNPQNDLKIIHVAGTNGKGSICRYVYEALQAGGYKTGLYTSPFIEVFNERIEFDHNYISDNDLETYTEAVIQKAEEMVSEGYDSPTEFEIITAIAFLYFKEKHADYVVLEVGLGGTGDSTNVVSSPLVSIIASISLDHTDRLGDTIARIAAEKAGIIKKGCTVVTSAREPEAIEIIKDTAAQKQCRYFNSNDFTYRILRESLDGYEFETEIFGEKHNLEISMLGEHQIENAMAALTAILAIRNEGKITLDDSAIKQGFRKAKHIGRFELMCKNPYFIIDGAHNPDGSKALCNAVNKYFAGSKILMVIGILADKDVDEVLDNFVSISKDFIVTQPDNPRRMTAEDLSALIESRGGRCIVSESAESAVDVAISKLAEYDLVLVAGSLYLIGEIRGKIRKCLN